MTDQLERELRLLFAEDADRAPAALSPATLAALAALAATPTQATPPAQAASAALAASPAAGRQVRQRRRSRIAWGAASLVAASVAAVVGAGALTSSPPEDRTTAPPAAQPSAAQSSADRRTGALPDAAGASCAVGYSPRELARRAFAFDGTVTAIGPGRTDRPYSNVSHAGVTFTVHEWFAGGSGATITVDMVPPVSYFISMGYGPPAYGVGTRLLVSGEHRWGGPTRADLIGWGCGFTIYYDPATADDWRAATH
jgi:hypothetical protein